MAKASKTPAPTQWLTDWVERDTTAGLQLAEGLTTSKFPNEPAVAQSVVAAAPPGSILTVGSSMPIRDVDTFAGKGPQDLRVFGNRGANGIDGLVAAALGTAAAGSNAIVLLGDVSLFHDLNSLGTAAQLGLPLTVVVINNNGGGIFSFLPQSDPEVLDRDVFERYLATPHETDFAGVASAFGLETHVVTDEGSLTELVGTAPTSPRLIEIRTSRADNYDLHRSIVTAIADRLR